MAASKSSVKTIKNITECPICTELFCNPRMLPCFHTFCLKCIEQYCRGKRKGDTMPCPMCRKKFKVPTGGLSELRVNCFVERLVAAESQSGINKVVNCDVCLIGKQCNEEASSFCMECQENMCEPCSNMHKSMKMSMTHHISAIEDSSNMEEIENKTRRTFCHKHPNEEIKFFCRDCDIPFCMTCSIAKHNRHDLRDIEDVVGDVKKGFKQHSVDVSELLTNIKKQSDLVEKLLASFPIRINTAEKNILKRSEAIKRMVDKQTKTLLEKLRSHKTEYLKNLQNTKEELQRSMMMCENYVSYCQKAIKNADAVESIRIAEELRTRAEDLNEEPLSRLHEFSDITFHPSNLDVANDLYNIIGNIHGKSRAQISYHHGIKYTYAHLRRQ